VTCDVSRSSLRPLQLRGVDRDDCSHRRKLVVAITPASVWFLTIFCKPTFARVRKSSFYLSKLNCVGLILLRRSTRPRCKRYLTHFEAKTEHFLSLAPWLDVAFVFLLVHEST